jgi:hypothetical protein
MASRSLNHGMVDGRQTSHADHHVSLTQPRRLERVRDTSIVSLQEMPVMNQHHVGTQRLLFGQIPEPSSPL